MKVSEKFFDSTRGKIIARLRGTTATVNDLSGELGLTDNAVRAQIAGLERDGLLRQIENKPGRRKPHFSYELTPESEALFPKAYDTIFNRFISVIKEKLAPGELMEALNATGISKGPAKGGKPTRENLEDRAEKAVKVLNSIGGAARVEKEDDKLFIRSRSCPISSIVAEHPEGCRIAEALVSSIVDEKVEERCDRTAAPKCTFAILEA
jgi:predicted ArsR family transcriptional regulator